VYAKKYEHKKLNESHLIFRCIFFKSKMNIHSFFLKINDTAKIMYLLLIRNRKNSVEDRFLYIFLPYRTITDRPVSKRWRRIFTGGTSICNQKGDR